MRPAEDDVYITVVVVRRPAQASAPDLDPNVLAQSVLHGIRAQEGMYSSTFSGGGRPRWSGSAQATTHISAAGWPGSKRRQAPARRRWWLLAVAIACWAGAVAAFYMLAKQGL